MSRKATLDRERLERFNRFWSDLYDAFPDARRAAVEAMGQAVKGDLDVQIQAADLEGGAKGTVSSWQELSIGSGGGYAAVAPGKGTAPPRPGQKQRTWKGKPVTRKQVTTWLERGHGTRKSIGLMGYSNGRIKTVPVRGRSGYVKGRMFYSLTKLKAVDHALRAADRVLSRIADEVDY